MSGYNVNVSQEVVQALNNMGNQLDGYEIELKEAVTELKTAFEENQAGLGAHTKEISELIDEVEQIGEEGTKLVLKLALKLKKAALVRQKHIEDTPLRRSYGRSR